MRQETTPILFQSAEEFQSRPNYVENLSCKPSDLDSIIGKYSFAKQNEIRCQLNGCNQNHQNGYIIKTKDGLETNCGHVCGKREFGVVFEAVEAIYKQAEDKLLRKRMLDELMRNKKEMMTQSEALLRDCNIAVTNISKILQEIEKDKALKTEFESTLKKNGRIQKEVFIKNEFSSQPSSSGGYYQFETIGEIQGIGVIGFNQKVTQFFRYEVIEKLKELDSIDVQSMNHRDLIKRTKDIDKIRSAIHDVQDFLYSSSRFCSKENLKTMTLLIDVIPKKKVTDRAHRIINRLSHMEF